MANKSRKRIKHEQRLYIRRLEQALHKLRRDAVKYEPITIHVSFILPVMHNEPARHKACIEMEFEHAIRNVAEQMYRNDVIEVVKTPIFMGAHEGERYDLKLTVLKTQSQRYCPPTQYDDLYISKFITPGQVFTPEERQTLKELDKAVRVKLMEERVLAEMKGGS